MAIKHHRNAIISVVSAMKRQPEEISGGVSKKMMTCGNKSEKWRGSENVAKSQYQRNNVQYQCHQR